MKQIVKFNNSSEDAKKVKQHFHDVVLDGSRLVFSKFDRQAFDLAVALEGLRCNTDYSFVNDDEEVSSDLARAVCIHTRPALVLEMSLCLSESAHYEFSLSVDPGARIVTTPEFDDFPLVIDPCSIELARVLQNETQRIISPILKASLQIERGNVTYYHLLIMGNRSSRIIRFYPTNFCLRVNPPSIENSLLIPLR